MHLFQHHQGNNKQHLEGAHGDHKTCYHCGRQFTKHKGMLQKLKRQHHCPGCHFEFQHSVEEEGSNKKSSTSIPHLSMSFPFASSRNKITKSTSPDSRAVHMTAASSFESTEIQGAESQFDASKEDGIIIADVSAKVIRQDSCPFDFTYETEEVESYQTTNHGEEVESYQLEWLIS